MMGRRLKFSTRDWVTTIAVTILAILLAWGVHQIVVIRAQNVALSKALAAQRQQVQDLGQKPVAPPPATILKDPSATMGPPGTPGANGATGPAGRGVASLVCISGKWRVQYTDGTVDASAGACTGPPGPIGATGTTGVGGSNGTNGADGAAGQPGAAGPSGAPGPPGADGKNGSDGKDGADGAVGQPPASWTWTSPLGLTYTCTRNSDSPDSAPTYACAAA